MKKFIVALATVAMTMGFSAQAQTEQKCEQAQKCAQAECRQAPGDCGFESLNLTDAQKEQLKALGKKRMEAKKDKKEARKEDARAFLADLKTILTPEQYVQFLENSFVNKGKFEKGRKDLRVHRHGKASRVHRAPKQGVPVAEIQTQADK